MSELKSRDRANWVLRLWLGVRSTRSPSAEGRDESSVMPKRPKLLAIEQVVASARSDRLQK